MQWVRFDADLTDRVERAYQMWKAQMPPNDPIKEDHDVLVSEPDANQRIRKLFDKRFIDYLEATGIPFERP